jgi:TolA-binding protein
MGTLRADILLAAARAHEKLKQTEQALPLLQQVTAMSTAEPAAEATYRIGTLQAASGDHAAAIENFLKAAYGFGYPRWQAASHLAAGRSHEALNQLAEAIKSYQEVINRHPELPEVELAKQRIDALNKQ